MVVLASPCLECPACDCCDVRRLAGISMSHSTTSLSDITMGRCKESSGVHVPVSVLLDAPTYCHLSINLSLLKLDNHSMLIIPNNRIYSFSA